MRRNVLQPACHGGKSRYDFKEWLQHNKVKPSRRMLKILPTINQNRTSPVVFCEINSSLWTSAAVMNETSIRH